MKNAVSVDVEEWFHPEILRGRFPQSEWGTLEKRAEQNVELLLRLFERRRVKATFFVLGWVAEQQPDLVPRIAAEGHEIASHGYAHQMITQQAQEEFDRDLALSLEILRAQSGQAVVGYRAPSFSIVRDTLWAFEFLLQRGIEYDSSIYPVHHDRYGIPEAHRKPYRVARNGDKELWELPPPAIRVLGKNLPGAGGGYMRLLPTWMSVYWIRKLNQEGLPAVVYTHPWEFDAKQPRLDMAAPKRLRHYSNIAKMESKLESILSRFQFGTCAELLNQIHAARTPEAVVA